MGLNITVLHVKDAGVDAVSNAITQAVAGHCWALSKHTTLSDSPESPGDNALQYLISPRAGNWVTVLNGHDYVQRMPLPHDLADALSRILSTYTLAVSVTHSDVLSYWLSLDGIKVDAYNSNPCYFWGRPLAREIAKQRHHPDALAPLLPSGINVIELKSLLDRGWWAAHDSGKLDADGLPPDEEGDFVFEADRMASLGNLLQLHGANGGYPYAGWPEEGTVFWAGLLELRFTAT